MKNKKWIIIGSVAAVVLLLIIFFVSSYNGFVNRQETVEEKWSNIEVKLQMRADNIPQLVEIVKDYTNYEQETLTKVIEARNTLNNPNAAINDKVDASSYLDVWVNALAEAYPELDANEQFKGLMDTVTSNEAEISYARKQYNEAVKDYNASIRRFPGNIIAGMFGFEKYQPFEMSPYAAEVPSTSVN